MRLPNFKEMNPRTKRFLMIQGAAIVVLILASVVIGNSMGSQHGTCLICHEMKPAVAAWQDSSHEKIACPKCHNSEPGYYGFMLGLPHKIKDAVTHISGEYPETIRAKEHVENRVCQRCHVSWRNVSPSGDLIVPHDKHFVKRGIACTACHSRVVHGETRDGEFMRRPAMQVCLSCHGSGREGAPILKCKDCHTEKAVPESHRTASWFEMHSKVMKDPSHPDSNCKKCHGWTTTFCSDCHTNNRPSTHYGGTKWRTYHSIRAAERKSGCLVCHNAENFCYRCHDPFEDLK